MLSNSECSASSLRGGENSKEKTGGGPPRPVPRPGWALVRVRATALNHHDLWTLRGVSASPIVPPQILGCDAAGGVEEDGRGGGGPEGFSAGVAGGGGCP